MIFRISLFLCSIFFCCAPALAQQPAAASKLKPGIALFQQGKFAEAAEAMELVVNEDPENGLAWFYLGLARHSGGEIDLALRAHFLALQFSSPTQPQRVSSMYNVACAYSLKGNAERALRWLNRARNAGFGNFSLMSGDSDLDFLRSDERFIAFQKSGVIANAAEASAKVSSITPVMTGGTGGVEVGPEGSLYVANFGSDVWVVQPDGSWRVLASGFTKAADCTTDADGNLIQVDFGASRVWSITPDGKKTDLNVQGLNGPVGIDMGPADSFYLTNFNANAILQVQEGGSTSVVASGGMLNGPNGLVNAGDAGLFIANYKDGAVIHLDPKTGAMKFICELPGGGNGHLAWDGKLLYATDRTGHRVFSITPAGRIAVVAGTGGQGIQAGGAATGLLSLPNGIALSPDSRTIYVNNRLTGNRSVVTRVDLQ